MIVRLDLVQLQESARKQLLVTRGRVGDRLHCALYDLQIASKQAVQVVHHASGNLSNGALRIVCNGRISSIEFGFCIVLGDDRSLELQHEPHYCRILCLEADFLVEESWNFAHKQHEIGFCIALGHQLTNTHINIFGPELEALFVQKPQLWNETRRRARLPVVKRGSNHLSHCMTFITTLIASICIVLVDPDRTLVLCG